MILNQERLAGLHPDLVKVVRLAGEHSDFAVLEGLRSVEREQDLIAKGHSALADPMKCRHVTGHAVDLGCLVMQDGKHVVAWRWSLYSVLAANMKQAASDLGISVEWGGVWKGLKDGDHFQLPWAKYPVEETAT